MSKILCPVMLCLWWHELKSKILWYVMLVLFVSKILCSVMNLTIYKFWVSLRREHITAVSAESCTPQFNKKLSKSRQILSSFWQFLSCFPLRGQGGWDSRQFFENNWNEHQLKYKISFLPELLGLARYFVNSIIVNFVAENQASHWVASWRFTLRSRA